MRDGSCLVTVVAGVCFLLLMELSRLGTFNGMTHALAAGIAPASTTSSDSVANKSTAATLVIHTNRTADNDPPYRTAGPHELRSRYRPNDRS
jgi:hypothetical protein